MEDVKIVGVVTEIIYQNPDNSYTVCEIESEEEGIFAATGYMPYLSVGETVSLSGRWVEHADYGEQFKAESYETLLPTDEDAILRYLSSGIVAGVGAATAKNLVAHFGKDTLEIMLNEPNRLSEIRGISPKKAEKISAAFLEIQSTQGIVIYLQQFNIGATVAMRAQKMLGRHALEKIKENPYILVDGVDGVGFKTADGIAFYQGMPKNSPVRIKHGIKYLLSEAAFKSGHTYLLKDVLTDAAAKLLDVSQDAAADGITSLALVNSVYIENAEGCERVSLALFHSAETQVARRLSSMANSLPKIIPTRQEIDEVIAKVGNEKGIELAPEQRDAVVMAAERSCMVITGGPGTGKTTILRVIIELMDKMSMKIALAAPTGRAAKRISELTGREAKTIHRMLGMKPSEEDSFCYNEGNPLDADVIIVDEASMIDILLMKALLSAIKPGAKLVLCGDADQLPSVGPGNVLRDIIASGKIKTIALKNIFRQAEASLIVTNAHRINRGDMPTLDRKDMDFFFLSRNGGDIITQTVTELYKTRLPKSYKVDAISKIQVLSPSKKGAAGTIALNKELQFAMNPPDMLKPEYRHGNTIFRVGDKVMQIKNDYDIIWTRADGEVGCGIFNGDMGIIESISLKDKLMTVIFDDREVEYPFANLDRLELAYAITVHKSQGSEFPIVILPVTAFAPMLMCRNILYTAVTRAQELVVMVGRAEEVEKMVKNNLRHKRYTSLSERLSTAD